LLKQKSASFLNTVYYYVVYKATFTYKRHTVTENKNQRAESPEIV